MGPDRRRLDDQTRREGFFRSRFPGRERPVDDTVFEELHPSPGVEVQFLIEFLINIVVFGQFGIIFGIDFGFERIIDNLMRLYHGGDRNQLRVRRPVSHLRPGPGVLLTCQPPVIQSFLQTARVAVRRAAAQVRHRLATAVVTPAPDMPVEIASSVPIVSVHRRIIFAILFAAQFPLEQFTPR